MAKLLKYSLFVTLLLLFGSINSHRDQREKEHGNEDDEDEQPVLNDVKRLFIKYASKNNSSRSILSIEHFEEIKMALLGQLKPENSGSFACYLNRLNELSVLLRRLNKTSSQNSYLDDSRFSKVSSLMIANFDRCYLGDSSLPPETSNNHTFAESMSHLYHQIVRNFGNLKPEGSVLDYSIFKCDIIIRIFVVV